MSKKQYKVMMNERNKSACIFDTKNEKVYMLAFFEQIGEMNDYIIFKNIDGKYLTLKECLEEAEIQIKYDSYIQKENELSDKLRRLENVKLPKDFDYHGLQSLSYESREKLNRYQPETLGQASRISGISPADINVLAIFLGR